MTPESFLRGIFDRAEEGYISIWHEGAKRAQWIGVKNVSHVSVPAKKNVYFGVGIHEQPASYGRGTAASVGWIPGLWSDVDYAVEGGNGAKKRASRHDAIDILMSMPIAPSVVIESGGGFHVYWLFDCVLAVEDDAAGLLVAWQDLIKSKFYDAGGYEIDSVADLARVLRPAGTPNWKHDGRIVEPLDGYGDPSQWNRIAVDAVLEFVKPAAVSRKIDYKLDDVSINSETNPDNDLFVALMQNSPKFKRTWEHRRTDLRDTSPSGWEMSLARQTAYAGWPDQEIVNLLVAHRRKWDSASVDKATSPHYLRSTMGKARCNSEYTQAKLRLIDEAVSESTETKAETNGEAPSPEEERRQLLTDISTVLGGLPVSGIEQMGRENSVWSFALVGGEKITVGTTAQLRGFESVAAAVLEQQHTVIQRMKRTEWDQILGKIMQVTTVVEDQESGDVETLRDLVEQYLTESDCGLFDLDPEQTKDHYRSGKPFVEEGCEFLNVPDFRGWLAMASTDRWNRRMLSMLLTRIGFTAESEVRHYDRPDGKDAGRRYRRRGNATL